MHTASIAIDLAKVPPASPWSALDDPDEWAAFSRDLKGRPGLMESFLAIDGMHCASCALKVEQSLARLSGVAEVQVNGATAIARLAWSSRASKPSEWLAAVKNAGYSAIPAPDLLAAVPRQREQRILLWRWLVAGFSMMQVMMYATPAYFADAGEITPDIVALLNWASWVLTLPVVLFCCWPFFSAAWRDLRHRAVGMDLPVALGIAIAFVASSIASFDPGGLLGHEVWYDSVTMFVFFLLSGRLLEQRLRDRTAGSLDALMRRLPHTVQRLRPDGSFERVPARRLAAGDAVRILAGEMVPADGSVLEGESRLDEALLTGESTPAIRRQGQGVIAGSHNLTGNLLVRVERTGRDTRYASIVALMEQASMDKPRLAQLADRFAKPFLLAVVLAAVAAALWWWPTDPGRALGVAVAVLIVTCPCALSLATPAATLAAAGALARRGILVSRLQPLETCASVDTVVFDKTGTLTQDRMGVASIRSREGTTSIEALQLAGALAHRSLHPASRAISTAAGTVGWKAHEVTEVAGRGVRGRVTADSGCQPRLLRLGSASFCDAPQAAREAPGLEVHLADESGWLATFALDEALRPDARRAVGELLRQGLFVELLSGDRMAPVKRLALRAGIDTALGSCSPEDKLGHVRRLQATGQRVVMVGDGVNDGPVLARADVSIAMGQGAPLAQAHSDFVILGGQLAAVPLLLKHARKTRRIVRQNLAWAAIYNAVCVPMAVLGAMPPWLAGLGMAASSLLVVANSARLARVD